MLAVIQCSSQPVTRMPIVMLSEYLRSELKTLENCAGLPLDS